MPTLGVPFIDLVEQILDEDSLNGESLDDGSLDDGSLDDGSLDEESLDEESLDEESLDEGFSDEESLDKGSLDEDPLEEEQVCWRCRIVNEEVSVHNSSTRKKLPNQSKTCSATKIECVSNASIIVLCMRAAQIGSSTASGENSHRTSKLPSKVNSQLRSTETYD